MFNLKNITVGGLLRSTLKVKITLKLFNSCGVVQSE